MISESIARSNSETQVIGDHELIDAFLDGSENAFATLVERHIDAVYSSALRQVHDSHTAADVTNAAFTILARKAARIHQRTVILAWLHRTTRFVALKALRAQSRRKQYEQEAVTMLEDSHSTDSAWDQMAPLLDAGLTQLSVKDHEAIVLRFFQGKTFPEIAAFVGSTEEGVRKRVDRAVEKLRRFFSKHGLAIPAAVLMSELATRAVESSPPFLASQIKVSTPRLRLSPLAAETLKALRWKIWKLGTASAVATAVILLLLRWSLPGKANSPLDALSALSQAAADGDGDRWSSLVHVQTEEERQAETQIASNIVAQSVLRQVLIQRFGRTEYEASAFPRMFDETPKSQLLTATQQIKGDQAVVHLARGSNLQFIRTSSGWKFDFFHTTTVRPAQLLAWSERDQIAVRQVTGEVGQGDYHSVREAQEAYERRRQ